MVSYEDNLIVKQTPRATMAGEVRKVGQGHGALVGEHLHLPSIADDERSRRLTDKRGRLGGLVASVDTPYHWGAMGDIARFTV